MLPLILALVSDPTLPPDQPATPPSAERIERWQSRCEMGGLQQANGAAQPALPQAQTGFQSSVVIRPQDQPMRSNDLLYREGDTLRLYLTLERRINGCAAPLFTEVNGFAADEE